MSRPIGSVKDLFKIILKYKPDKKDEKQMKKIIKNDKSIRKELIKQNLFVKPKKSKHIKYKDPRIVYILSKIPLYEKEKLHDYNVGDIVKYKNDAICQIILKDNKKFCLFIPQEKVLNSIDLIIHQGLKGIKWPDINDNNFNSKIYKIFKDLGYNKSDKIKEVDENLCNKSSGKVKLSNYQKIASTYLSYGPYRGLLLWHGLGSGKTCSSIDIINNHLIDNYYNEILSQKPPKKGPSVYVILPPSRALEQNYRSELSKKCPNLIKNYIEKKNVSGIKIDYSNRAINQYVGIYSYVSMANQIQSNKINLDNSLIILDEAHNLLYPAVQFKKKYEFLVEQIKRSKNIKILLLSATPIYKSITDLTKLLNMLKRSDEVQFSEEEHEFRKKYLNNDRISKNFYNDIKGLISFYSIDKYDKILHKTLFGQKELMDDQVVNLTQDHDEKWLKSYTNEMKGYDADMDTDLMDVKSKKYLDKVSGYLKKSSAMVNYPVISYRKKGIWPKKFEKLLKNLQENEGKHFIISRHRSSGSNAIGFYLEKNGWTRFSNNTKDHGTDPSKMYKRLGKELKALENLKNTGKIADNVYVEKRKNLFKKYDSEGNKGFVVYNALSSMTESANGKLLFNAHENTYGKYVKVFIGDESYGEGVSLLNTTNVHLFEPNYSYQKEEQAIARAIRRCSHKDLPLNKRKVKVFKYFAVYQKEKDGDIEETTDDFLENYSLKRQKVLQCIISASVKGSIDYMIHQSKWF